jgi:hypothetical protein
MSDICIGASQTHPCRPILGCLKPAFIPMTQKYHLGYLQPPIPCAIPGRMPVPTGGKEEENGKQPPWTVLQIRNGAQCAPYIGAAFANLWSWLQSERLFVTEN